MDKKRYEVGRNRALFGMSMLTKPQMSLSTWTALKERYVIPANELDCISLGQEARNQGYLDFEAFCRIAKWKSPRPEKYHRKNDPLHVLEVTAASLSSVDPIAAIVELTALSGIQIRSASAILHLCSSRRYPLLDFRAMEAFGVTEAVTANWDELSWLRVWKPYTAACCELADELKLTMRDIDRALWVLGGDAAWVRSGVNHA